MSFFSSPDGGLTKPLAETIPALDFTAEENRANGAAGEKAHEGAFAPAEHAEDERVCVARQHGA
jgi:hypothetical protein